MTSEVHADAGRCPVATCRHRRARRSLRPTVVGEKLAVASASVTSSTGRRDATGRDGTGRGGAELASDNEIGI